MGSSPIEWRQGRSRVETTGTRVHLRGGEVHTCAVIPWDTLGRRASRHEEPSPGGTSSSGTRGLAMRTAARPSWRRRRRRRCRSRARSSSRRQRSGSCDRSDGPERSWGGPEGSSTGNQETASGEPRDDPGCPAVASAPARPRSLVIVEAEGTHHASARSTQKWRQWSVSMTTLSTATPHRQAQITAALACGSA